MDSAKNPYGFIRTVLNSILDAGFFIGLILGLIWTFLNYDFVHICVLAIPVILTCALVNVFFSKRIGALRKALIGLWASFSPAMIVTFVGEDNVLKRKLILVLVIALVAFNLSFRYLKKHLSKIIVFVLALGGVVLIFAKNFTEKDPELEFLRDKVQRYCYAGIWSAASDYLPEEITGVLKESNTDLYEVSWSPENVRDILCKRVEETVGESKAKEIYLEMCDIFKEARGKDILKESIYDTASYIAPSLMLGKQLSGHYYSSVAGQNFGVLCAKTPRIGLTVTNYFRVWPVMAFGLFIVLFLMQVIFEKKKPAKDYVFRTVAIILVILINAAICAFKTAGMSDFRYASFILVLWSLMIFDFSSAEEQ